MGHREKQIRINRVILLLSTAFCLSPFLNQFGFESSLEVNLPNIWDLIFIRGNLPFLMFAFGSRLAMIGSLSWL